MMSQPTTPKIDNYTLDSDKPTYSKAIPRLSANKTSNFGFLSSY